MIFMYLYKFVICIFIYISVTFIVFAATMFMVNKDYHNGILQ